MIERLLCLIGFAHRAAWDPMPYYDRGLSDDGDWRMPGYRFWCHICQAWRWPEHA